MARKAIGTITRTKTGRWQPIVTLADGKRKRLPALALGTTEDEARRAAREATQKIRRPPKGVEELGFGMLEKKGGHWFVLLRLPDRTEPSVRLCSDTCFCAEMDGDPLWRRRAAERIASTRTKNSAIAMRRIRAGKIAAIIGGLELTETELAELLQMSVDRMRRMARKVVETNAAARKAVDAIGKAKAPTRR